MASMVQKLYLVLGLFVVCNAVLENSYFHGRSGDILLKPKNIEDDSRLVLVNFGIEDQHTLESCSIDDTEVASFISQQIGGPYLRDVTSECLARKSLFNKDTSNVMIVLDNFDKDVMSKYGKTMKSLQHQQLKLNRVSFPEDSVATLTSISCGVTPSTHGIINKSWKSVSGVESQAYQDYALPAVENMFDFVAQSFSGESLILGASANFQMSAAISVSQFIQSTNPSFNNYALHWNKQAGSFKSVYGSTMRNAFQFSREKLSKYALQFNELDLQAKEVSNFFAEVTFLHALLDEIQTDTQLKSLVADRVPDLFSIAISSIQDIKNVYSVDSPQFGLLMSILDQTLLKFITSIVSLYNGKLSVEIILLDNSALLNLKNDEALKNDVQTIVGSIVEQYFPIIYLGRNSDQQDICDKLDAVVPEDIQVVCMEKPISPMGTVINSFIDQATNGTVTTDIDTQQFHLLLWGSIVLAIALYGAIYTLVSMDVGADSLLYRMTNVKQMR